MDDITALATILGCLTLIGIGKDTATVTSVLLTVIGFMFGRHTRKQNG